MDDSVIPIEDTIADTKPSEVITVNFNKGEIINKVQYDEDGGIPKVLRELAKFAKKENTKSIAVLTINDKNHVDWVFISDSELHMALAALCLDDLKADLKAKIFGPDEEEE